MKRAFVLIFILALGACSQNNKELIKFKEENRQLSKERDSLRSVLDSIILRPYIDNMSMTIRKNEEYRTHLLAIVKNGVTLNSLKINGKSIDLEVNSKFVKYDDFGPLFMFKSDTVGKFRIEAGVVIKTWGDRVIPVSWLLAVQD